MVAKIERTLCCVTLLGVVFTVTAVVGFAQQPLRTWTSADGKYKTEARFVELNEAGVILEKAGGKRVTVPLSRLSEADRHFVASLKTTVLSETPPPFGTNTTSNEEPPAGEPTSPPELEEEIAARLTAELPTAYRQVREIQAHDGAVENVAFSADGLRLISVSKANECCVWEVATGERVSRLATPFSGTSYTVALSADGKLGALGGSFKQIHLFNADTGKLVRSYDAEAEVSHVSFAKGGEFLIAADAAGGAMRLAIKGDGHTLHQVARGRSEPFTLFAALGPNFLVVGDWNKFSNMYLVAFTAEEGRTLALPKKFIVDVVAGGDQLFFVDAEGGCTLDTVAVKKPGVSRPTPRSAKFDVHFLGNFLAAITPDGDRYLAIEPYDGKGAFGEADFPTAPCRATVTLPVEQRERMVFGPDLLTIALRGDDGKISFWKLDDFPTTREARLARMSREWLLAGQYDKLEALDQWLRANPGVIRHRTAEAQQGLLVFCLGQWTGEVTEHMPRLKSWVEARPQSTLARLALASHYVQLAQHIRGNGFANTVPRAAMQHFEELSKLAFETLEPLLEAGKAPPCAYAIVFLTAMADGWNKEQYSPYVEQLLKLEPTYCRAHQYMVQKLLPRWGGEKGESEQYAARVADRVGGGAGDALYARLAAHVRLFFPAPEFFDYTDFDYDRIQRGLAYEKKESPNDPWAFFEAVLFAHVQADAAPGRQASSDLAALAKKQPLWVYDAGIESPVFDDVTRVYYDRARKWASRLNRGRRN
jgi:hypothetical protein